MKTNRIPKRMFLIITAFVLLMSACGPAATSTPTPDVNIAYTQAAETVVANLTASAPSATPPPPPATPTPIILPSSTPAPTATSTLPPAPTTPPDDPVLSLGAPAWQDSFDSKTNWTLFDNECFRNDIANGRHELLGKGIGYVCWTITWPDITDFYLETTVQTIDSCPAANSFGLFFRSPSNDQGYLFGISCDGRYTLWTWDAQEGNFVVKPTASPQIMPGPNQTNRLGVMVKGDSFGLYINGVLQTEVQDTTFSGPGKFGLAIFATKDNPMSVFYDQIAYWDLP
jgi:hypothetical protein